MLRIERLRWPAGIADKVLSKHGLYTEEVEEGFEHPERRFLRRGDRYILLSRTGGGKYVFIVFELEQNEAIVVTARGMTLRERRAYRRK